MAVKFSIAEGGFIQDTSGGSNKVEFKVQGDIENPNLVPFTSPSYTSTGMTINLATLAINNGQIGTFKLEVRSADLDGTNETTHISGTVTVSTAAPQGLSLTVGTPTIAANKVIKLYLQYLTGAKSSDISVTLE